MTDPDSTDGTDSNGKTFRRTDRTDAPLYLARYAERRSTTVMPCRMIRISVV